MKTRTSISALLAGTLAAGIALAQTAPTTGAQDTQPSDPSSASSPHQRAVTKSPTGEATPNANGTNPSDASTPHQKQTTSKKKSKKKTTPPPSSNS